MKNNFLTIIFVVLICGWQYSLGGEHPKIASVMFSTVMSDSAVTPITTVLSGNEAEKSSRRTTAIIYSCILPGSGQTMLGNTYKGVSLSIIAFGSALTAGISHNNFIARNERLDALEFEYANAASWENADLIYTSMRVAHSQLQRDRNRRDLFLVISAVIWAANIVDILYFTEDEGQTLFSSRATEQPLVIGMIDSPHKPLLSLSLPLH